jgi:hypothetical protein
MSFSVARAEGGSSSHFWTHLSVVAVCLIAAELYISQIVTNFVEA